MPKLKLMDILISDATTLNLCVKNVQIVPPLRQNAENFSAGDRGCWRWKYKRDILDMAAREKVTIERAKQMLANNLESVNPKPKSKFPTHFNRKLSTEHERKLSLFLLEKCIANHTGSKPRTFRTKHVTTFIIEVSSHTESIAITIMDRIHNYPVQTGIITQAMHRKLLK